VSEEVADDLQRNAALQQVHAFGMAQVVRTAGVET
jgi:hypothetical protein